MKKRKSRAKGILLVAFLIFAVVLGGLVFRKYNNVTRLAQLPPKAAPGGTVVATLFFAAPGGKGLVREGREVDVEETVEDGVESVLDEVISGPIGSHAVTTLPPNARILGVRLNGNVAQIDFGSELKEAMSAGTSAEMAAVYAIVDTVTTNFPAINAVQILVEGAPLSNLGQLDLKDPLPPDYTLEQSSQEQPAAK